MLFYAGAPEHEWAEIAVDDPGHGYLVITRLDDVTAPASSTFAGQRLGDLLDRVTAAATDLDAAIATLKPNSGPTLHVGRAEAVELLPGLIRAVALAIGGTGRYDRIWAEDSEPDAPPLCVYCNQGSPYHQVVTISEHCSESGHTPFAAPGAPNFHVHA